MSETFRNYARFAVCVLGVAFSTNLMFASEVCSDFPGRGMIAHRGDGADFPENTIPAFLSAIEKGAEMVELDEWKCKSGELVVIHDYVVDRVAKDVKGKVSELTLAELKSLDVGIRRGEQFRGTRIPTLEEALAVFPKKGVLINLHCKTGAAGPEAAEIVKTQGRTRQVVFMMDSFEDVLLMQEKCPWAQIGWVAPAKWRGVNTEFGEGWWHPWSEAQADKIIDVAIALKVQYLQILFDCRLTKRQTERLHSAGIKTTYFECNDPAKMKGLVEEGEDFIFTDRFSKCRSAYESAIRQ